jgi:hypothetical protein
LAGSELDGVGVGELGASGLVVTPGRLCFFVFFTGLSAALSVLSDFLALSALPWVDASADPAVSGLGVSDNVSLLVLS